MMPRIRHNSYVTGAPIFNFVCIAGNIEVYSGSTKCLYPLPQCLRCRLFFKKCLSCYAKKIVYSLRKSVAYRSFYNTFTRL